MALPEQPVKQTVTGRQYGRSDVLTLQFASAGLYCPHNSGRCALEELVSQNARRRHLPQNSCRGRRPIEGAVPGPPALLTPHRPRSPQQRAVQSQSAFASAAVGHHADPEIPPPGSLPLHSPCPLPGPCSSGTRALVVCAPQGVVISVAITFFTVSKCHGRARFLRSPRRRKDPPPPHLAGGVITRRPRPVRDVLVARGPAVGVERAGTS